MEQRALSRLRAGPFLLVLDIILVACAWPGTLAATGRLGVVLTQAPVLLALFPAGFLLFLCALGLFRREALAQTRASLGRASLAAGAGPLLAAALAALPWPDQPALATALLVPAVVCFLLTGFAARIALFLLRRRGAFRQRVLIIGAGSRAADLVLLLRREGRALNYELAFAHNEAMGAIDPRIGACGRIYAAGEGFLRAAAAFGADQIVVAPDDRRGLAMDSLLAAKVAGYPVHEYLGFLEREIGRVDVKRIELGWLLYADGFRFSPLDRALKRLLDVIAALLVLVPAAPLLLLAALAIWLESGRPILYRQPRVTVGGRVFQILKLRSMRADAESAGARWAAVGDARVTRVGRWLRSSRLDELPQLFNVLMGAMSLVGPRPERPQFTAELAKSLPLYNERHLVKAGLTGWAQINYPYGASVDDARSKLSYDLFYVKNHSLLFDLLIMLQTARVVLWPSGAR